MIKTNPQELEELIVNLDYHERYISLTKMLEKGEHTFQVKIEQEGLVLDVFHRTQNEYKHKATKSIIWEELND